MMEKDLGEATSRQHAVKRVLVAFGFGLTILIDLLYTWGGWVFESSGIVDFQMLLLVWSTPHGLTNALVFLILALISGHIRFRWMIAILPIGAALVIMGHLLLLSMSEFVNPVFLIVLAATLIGAGTSILLAGWVVIFAHLSTDENHVLIMFAIVIFAVMFVSIDYLSESVLAYLSPVLVVVSTSILCILFRSYYLSSRRQEGRLANPLNPSPNSGKSRLPLGDVVTQLKSPLCCAIAIGFAVPLTRISVLIESVDIWLLNNAVAVSAIAVVLTLFLIRYGLGRNSSVFRNFNIPTLFKFALPLVATILVLYAIFGSPLALPTSVIVFVLYYLVWLLAVPTCIQAAADLKISPLLSYGITGCVMNLVFAGATCLGAFMLAGELLFGAATLSVCMLLVFYVFMMAIIFQNWRIRRAIATDETAGKSFTGNQDVMPARIQQIVDEDAAALSSSIKQICENLVAEHQLTSREYDILILLAQGRDVPYISNQLFISKNTVRTHIKSIYLKIDVHSRQELLDLLDGLRT